MGIFRKLWTLAALVAALDFIASPSKSVDTAFRVATSSGPRFYDRGKTARRVIPPDFSAEIDRFQKEGLETLEKVVRRNANASLAD